MPEPDPHTRGRGAADVRPGAMTRAMRAAPPASGPRWLRWAVVRDARIVREGCIGPDATLDVGAEGDVPWRERAGRAPLAFFRDGRWCLSVHRSWTGRLGERPLERLDANSNGFAEIALDDDARGRLVIGDVAVLLQMVERPPVRRAPPLPPAIRGSILERADWSFTAFVTASFMVHFAIIAFVLEADYPIERALIPERAVEYIFTPPSEPPPDEVVAERMEGPEETREEVIADAPVAPTPREPRGEPRSPDPQPRLSDEQARELGRAAIARIGAIMGDEGSAMDTVIDGADMPSHADLIELAGRGVTMNDPPGELREREGGTRGCVGDECLGTLRRLAGSQHGRPIEEGAPIEEVTVVVTPAPGGPQIDEPPPGFDTRELIRALRMRMTAVRRCFEREITRGNPDAGGRLSIAMRVMPAGHLTDVRAEENETGSEALADCAVRTLARVRVRVGPSEPLEVRYPIVFQRRE